MRTPGDGKGVRILRPALHSSLPRIPAEYLPREYLPHICSANIFKIFARVIMQHLIHTTHQVGDLLQRRRKARRMPQRELATHLGLSQGRLSVLEGDPKALTLQRLLLWVDLLGLELVLREKTSNVDTPDTEW